MSKRETFVFAAIEASWHLQEEEEEEEKLPLPSSPLLRVDHTPFISAFILLFCRLLSTFICLNISSVDKNNCTRVYTYLLRTWSRSNARVIWQTIIRFLLYFYYWRAVNPNFRRQKKLNSRVFYFLVHLKRFFLYWNINLINKKNPFLFLSYSYTGMLKSKLPYFVCCRHVSAAVHYNDYSAKMRILWIIIMTMAVMPIVADALGTIPKELLKRQEDLEIRGQVETIQTIALLWSAIILRRVLETWGDLLSLKL